MKFTILAILCLAFVHIGISGKYDKSDEHDGKYGARPPPGGYPRDNNNYGGNHGISGKYDKSDEHDGKYGARPPPGGYPRDNNNYGGGNHNGGGGNHYGGGGSSYDKYRPTEHQSRYWSSCGSLLATARSLGCRCGTYKTSETCGFLYLGRRYLCYC
ncbi:hypothetical protein niasHS_011719 [Heterodera schachtii]|uniref:Uncharacterized protein n=1 Tax=Heterodera schachtii TaxID=97005 RepID=A0ABD2II45_HETSC